MNVLLWHDSCIFVCTAAPDEHVTKQESLLGQKVDELSCFGTGTYITLFVSGGSKFYDYLTFTPNTDQTHDCCKFKVITLKFASSQKINYARVEESIRSRYRDDDDEPAIKVHKNIADQITLKFRRIAHTATHNIVTKDEVKTFCLVLRKRRFIGRDFSLPFRYKRDANEACWSYR